MQDADTKAVAAVIAAAKNMVWVTGAGLSVASGISPYRGDADAVWANFITEWGTIARFRQDPAAWYRAFWFKAHPSLRGDPDAVQPNAGHEAITALQKARAHKVITQNIDGLHRRSGAPAALTVEIHGRHDTYVCSDSNCSMGRTPLEGFSAVDFDPEGHGGGTGGGDVDDLPECEVCGAVLRPLVLLFDEYYDSQPFYRTRDAQRWLRDADVVAFVGTSFSVGITAMAVEAAQATDAQIININPVPFDVEGTLNLRERSEVCLPAIAAAIPAAG